MGTGRWRCASHFSLPSRSYNYALCKATRVGSTAVYAFGFWAGFLLAWHIEKPVSDLAEALHEKPLLQAAILASAFLMPGRRAN